MEKLSILSGLPLDRQIDDYWCINGRARLFLQRLLNSNDIERVIRLMREVYKSNGRCYLYVGLELVGILTIARFGTNLSDMFAQLMRVIKIPREYCKSLSKPVKLMAALSQIYEAHVTDGKIALDTEVWRCPFITWKSKTAGGQSYCDVQIYGLAQCGWCSEISRQAIIDATGRETIVRLFAESPQLLEGLDIHILVKCLSSFDGIEIPFNQNWIPLYPYLPGKAEEYRKEIVSQGLVQHVIDLSIDLASSNLPERFHKRISKLLESLSTSEIKDLSFTRKKLWRNAEHLNEDGTIYISSESISGTRDQQDANNAFFMLLYSSTMSG